MVVHVFVPFLLGCELTLDDVSGLPLMLVVLTALACQESLLLALVASLHPLLQVIDHVFSVLDAPIELFYVSCRNLHQLPLLVSLYFLSPCQVHKKSLRLDIKLLLLTGGLLLDMEHGLGLFTIDGVKHLLSGYFIISNPLSFSLHLEDLSDSVLACFDLYLHLLLPMTLYQLLLPIIGFLLQILVVNLFLGLFLLLDLVELVYLLLPFEFSLLA